MSLKNEIGNLHFDYYFKECPKDPVTFIPKVNILFIYKNTLFFVNVLVKGNSQLIRAKEIKFANLLVKKFKLSSC